MVIVMQKFDEEYTQQYGIEVIKFIKLMISRFFEQIRNREIPEINRIYNEIRNALIREIESNNGDMSFKERDKYLKKQKALDSLYQLLKKSEIIEEIKSAAIGQEIFFNKYAEDILGDNKRHYDMRELYDSNNIAKLNKNVEKNKIAYKSFKSSTESEFKDFRGRKIRILPLGELAYETKFGARESLTQYRIQKENDEGFFSEVNVFSEISIEMMRDDSYREAVLNELLSENNIALSNCEGYIGKIENRSTEQEGDKTSSERFNRDAYSYRVNKNNVLAFEKSDVSAVIDFKLGKGINLDYKDNQFVRENN